MKSWSMICTNSMISSIVLKIMEDYEVNVQALLHGAKKEDVKLTHWITKIKREEE